MIDAINNNSLGTKGFNLVHLNIRSLFCKNKFEMFKQQLTDSNIHVIGISESWLNNEIPSNIIQIKGYEVIRNDRNWSEKKNKTKKGGGVCLYIKKDIIHSCEKYSYLNESSKNIESQWISLNQPNMREIIIVNIYRPPQGNIKEFCEKLNDDLLNFDSVKKREFYFMGDFNVNTLDKSDENSKELNSLFTGFGFKSFIHETTRYGDKKDNCIDNIYSNSDIIKNAGTLNWNFSDHQAVFVHRKKTMVKKTHASFVGRSYKNYDKNEFQEKLRELPWNDFFGIEDPNICWSILIDKILSILDEFCPEKHHKIFSYREPWMNKDIMEFIIDKDKALKTAKKSNIDDDWKYARMLRNNVGSLIDSAKKNFLNDEFISSKNDPKKFWRNINTVLPNSKRNEKSKILLKNNSGENIDEIRTADYINEFFSNIGPNLAKDFNSEWEYFGKESELEISDIKINKIEVIKYIKDIDLTKSSGIEKISSKCLKDALLALSAQLIHIFEMSIKHCIFPKTWKIATIVPLFKSGKKTDVSNYRPVSLLPIPGKILEKIIHGDVANFLENNKLLCDKQGGFRKNHSTLSSITEFTNNIFNAINSKELTVAIFFDLKKAFDTVNHKILIKKLEKMGIRGNVLLWIENYLSERKQKTICNNNLSEKKNVLCGVPQGSILGPLLFLVYINDIENAICNSKFQLYADDTVIYNSGSSIDDIKISLQNNIDKFAKWCIINKLTINTKKTKIMIFGSRYNIKRNSTLELRINGESLQIVPTYKYLGINLDQTLNFNYHLKNVVNQISRKLYIFSKIRRFLNDQAALILYKTMILPFFDYVDAVFMFSNSVYLKKLDRLHMRGLRISLRLHPNLSEEMVLFQCKISNLDNRRHVHLRNFMYNRKYLCHNNFNDDNRICTRSNAGPTFDVIKPNCETFKRNICYSGAIDWNNLNAETRNIENIFLFKKIQNTWLNKTFNK